MFPVSASGFDVRIQSVAPLANGFSNVLVVQLYTITHAEETASGHRRL